MDHVFLKVTASTAPQVPALRRMFPDCKLVFNTRHPRPSVASFVRVHTESVPRLVAATTINWGPAVCQVF